MLGLDLRRVGRGTHRDHRAFAAGNIVPGHAGHRCAVRFGELLQHRRLTGEIKRGVVDQLQSPRELAFPDHRSSSNCCGCEVIMTSRAPAAPVSIAGLRLAASSTNAGSPRLTTQPTEHVGLTYRSIATALARCWIAAALSRRG
jgi:hypothetical protein